MNVLWGYSTETLKTKQIFCAINFSILYLSILETLRKIRLYFMTNLCRKPNNSEGFTNFQVGLYINFTCTLHFILFYAMNQINSLLFVTQKDTKNSKFRMLEAQLKNSHYKTIYIFALIFMRRYQHYGCDTSEMHKVSQSTSK